MAATRALLGTFVALCIGAGTAFAQDFPSRPIELVVPYGPGGTTDVIARALAQAAEEHLPNRHRIVVVNRPGGGATIGMSAAFTAAPDGHTVTFTTASPLVLQPLYGNTPYKPEDFQPIIRFYDIPSSINVHVSSDIETFDDWLAWVQANPGQFTYGSSGGAGSGGHIAAEQLALALGVELRHVPFGGAAELVTAVMGGQIMGSNQLPDLHNGGELRPIIFTTPTKPAHEAYEDTPTTRGLGIEAEAVFFSGIVGHRDIPRERVAVLHDAFRAAMETPAVRELFERYQLTPTYAGPEEFGTIMEEAVAANRTTMRELGLIE